jgi:hypothetical protein
MLEFVFFLLFLIVFWCHVIENTYVNFGGGGAPMGRIVTSGLPNLGVFWLCHLLMKAIV